MSKFMNAYKLNAFVKSLNNRLASDEISYAEHYWALIDYKIANGLNYISSGIITSHQHLQL